MSHLQLIGLNHKTAPIEVREQLALKEPAQVYLKNLKQQLKASECALLSTCNRTEIYAVFETPNLSTNPLVEGFFQEVNPNFKQDLTPFLYGLKQREAVSHLFKVASGLDSLVPGENQILSQVKKSYLVAQDERCTGSVLNKLFPWALKVGKKARNSTGINQGASSVSSAALELAKQIFDTLDRRKIVLLGAGEMIEITLRLLQNSKPSQLTILNRTLENAQKLAQDFEAQAGSLDELEEHLVKADFIFSCTNSPVPILTHQQLNDRVSKRRGRPLLLIDIAVPRDIDPSCQEIDNIFLYNIDDLEQVVSDNLDKRKDKISLASQIIDQEVDLFSRYLNSRNAIDSIVTMREQHQLIYEQELNYFEERFNLNQREEELLQLFAHRLSQKLLHQPTISLKKLSERGYCPSQLSLIVEMLGIEEKEGNP